MVIFPAAILATPHTIPRWLTRVPAWGSMGSTRPFDLSGSSALAPTQVVGYARKVIVPDQSSAQFPAVFMETLPSLRHLPCGCRLREPGHEGASMVWAAYLPIRVWDGWRIRVRRVEGAVVDVITY